MRLSGRVQPEPPSAERYASVTPIAASVQATVIVATSLFLRRAGGRTVYPERRDDACPGAECQSNRSASSPSDFAVVLSAGEMRAAHQVGR